VDTLQAFNNLSYQAQSTSFFVNPYAAMPSLHVGWAVLLAIGAWRAWPDNRLVVVLVVLHPLTQWISTVVTGNHFWLDGVAGLLAAALGLAFAVSRERWRLKLRPSHRRSGPLEMAATVVQDGARAPGVEGPAD
jgi:membrane-associated phospholipid phosphatase